MIRVRSKFDPAIVFIPSSTDIHQDHQIIHIEGVRAYKNRTVLGYELPWNHILSQQNLFIELRDYDLARKVKLLNEYKSQIQLGRPYFEPDFMMNLAKLRGSQAGVDAAESFEVIRMNFLYG